MEQRIDWKKLQEEPYAPLAQVAREVAADGCVLLKNEGNILPFKKEDKISVFGRTQIDYYKSGTGSGGLVRVNYVVNIIDGMLANDNLTINTELVDIYRKWIEQNPFDAGAGWAQEPWCQKEMVPDEQLVKDARAKSDAAVIVLGRTAGEDRDNGAEKGSWYLTDEEEALLGAVSKQFEKTVVLLNVGNIIDMKWVEKYNIKSVLYIWQGGQEGGNAVADILCGDVNPSGRLTDTIAKDITLYPSVKNFGNEDFNLYSEDIYVGYRYFETFAKDDVLYPFGFGLSYTQFEKTAVFVTEQNGVISMDVDVKNSGPYKGRDVIEVYFEAPQGQLGKSARELCAFAKTKLLDAGETERVHLSFPVAQMAAYDDGGVTGNKSCYVLEPGAYNIYVGACVRCAEKAYTYTVNNLTVTQKCTEAVAPERDFDVMYPVKQGDSYKAAYRKAAKRTVDYENRLRTELPRELAYTGDQGIKLIDVKSGKNTMEEFVAQLSDTDLMCLARGEGMCSPKVRAGSAGAAGGVTERLAQFGIPVIAMHDGPSGIRMDSGEKATSLPNGTAVACTWDVCAAEKLYEYTAVELCTHRIDSLLGPGINIHRVPLNGRNFEYFSEDPYLTGKIAAALIRGMGKYGTSATVKHFAANSQEYKRSRVDSVMSERAAREIYLKGFEIAVKEGHATSLMTSYNPFNGRWSANNYELNTIILRNEWGYRGFVVTDWWPTLAEDESACKNLKDMVAAQNDIFMPTEDALTYNDNLAESLKSGALTRGQLQRNAMNILRYIANSHALERFIEFGGKLEKSLAEQMDKLETVFEIAAPKNSEETEVVLPQAGKYLFCVEYSSDAPEIAQMVINLKVRGISLASMTVHGNAGKTDTVFRDATISCNTPESSSVAGGAQQFMLKAEYPEELLKIHKIEIKK